MVSDAEFADLRAQVARQGELIERLYQRIGLGPLDDAGLPIADGSYPDVIEAIHSGSIIEAIKRYRAHTHVGLKEAKDAVEALARAAG